MSEPKTRLDPASTWIPPHEGDEQHGTRPQQGGDGPSVLGIDDLEVVGRLIVNSIPRLSAGARVRIDDALRDFLRSILGNRSLSAFAAVDHHDAAGSLVITLYVLWARPIALEVDGATVNGMFERHAEFARALDQSDDAFESALKIVDATLYPTPTALRQALRHGIDAGSLSHLLECRRLTAA